MSLSLRLNLVAILFFIIVLIFGVQSTLKTSVHYIQQQQQISLDLASQVIEAKISLFQTYPFIEVRPEKLAELFKLHTASDSKYLIIELFDISGNAVAIHSAHNEHVDTKAPDFLFELLAYLFEPVEDTELELVISDFTLAKVLLRPDRQAELRDVWSDAVEKLIPVFGISLIIILFVILFTTTVIRPVAEFIKSVNGHQKGIGTANLLQVRGLLGLSKQLKGIDKELKSSTSKVDHLNQRLIHLQEEERRRISAELHDELGQHLTAIRFESAAINSARTIDETKQSAEAIDQIGREMKEIIRSMLIRLRPPELEQLGLLGALKEMMSEWHIRNPHIELGFDCKVDLSSLDLAAQHNIYRIVQEALTNISKHAGSDQINVDVTMQREQHYLLLKIADDGVGTDLTQPSKGHGMKGMRERVESFSGKIEFESGVGQGLTVNVFMPINIEGLK